MRRPDDYDAKKVADLGPSEPSTSLNSLVLAQLKRPPPPPPEPEAPPAPAPAPPLAAPQGPAPGAATGDVEDGEVGGAVPVTRVLKLEHMVRGRGQHTACSASVQFMIDMKLWSWHRDCAALYSSFGRPHTECSSGAAFCICIEPDPCCCGFACCR